MEPTTGVIELDGARLPYRVEGRGIPTIVLASSVYYPRTFSQNLREHLQLAFVDLRHWVPSDPDFDIDGITLDTYSEDIDRIRQVLGHERVLVIGHSIHGLIALEYARRYPQHVIGAIVIGSPPVAGEELDAAYEAYWESDASLQRKRVLGRNMAALEPELEHLPPGEGYVRTYVARAPAIWYDPEYDCTPLWEGVVFNMPVFQRLGSLFDGYDLALEAPPIRVPVLVVLGSHDYGVPPNLWEKRRGVIADADYRLFEQSGHTPQLEEPERFDRTVLDWLQGVENRSG